MSGFFAEFRMFVMKGNPGNSTSENNRHHPMADNLSPDSILEKAVRISDSEERTAWLDRVRRLIVGAVSIARDG